jgi:hypothetical protein
VGVRTSAPPIGRACRRTGFAVCADAVASPALPYLWPSPSAPDGMSRMRPGSRPRTGGSGGPVAPPALQSSRHHAQTPQPSPCPAASGSAPAVRGNRVSRAHPAGAILSHGGLARFVRPRSAGAAMGPHRHRGTAPVRPAPRSGRRDQCTRRAAADQAPSRVSGPVGRSALCHPPARYGRRSGGDPLYTSGPMASCRYPASADRMAARAPSGVA